MTSIRKERRQNDAEALAHVLSNVFALDDDSDIHKWIDTDKIKSIKECVIRADDADIRLYAYVGSNYMKM